MKTVKVTVTWDGKSWGVSSDGNPPKGTTISLLIPEESKPTTSSKKHGPLMFNKGTYLYYPVKPTKNEQSAWSLWEQHKAGTHPHVVAPSDKVLIPILLEEDLHLGQGDSTSFSPCRCRVGEKSFSSVNKAASGAVIEWTDRETAAVGVFEAVCFLHDGMRLRLDFMRKYVLDEQQLPSKQDAGEGTAWLFGEEDSV